MDNKLSFVLFVMLLFAALGVSTHQHRVTNAPTTEFEATNDAITLNLTDDVTKESYSKFLTNLRSQLDPEVGPYNIKRLQDPSTLPDSKRYFQVGLVYESYSISLGINKTNAYIVAYERKNISYFFKDSNFDIGKQYLFQNTKQTKLSFSGSYIDLGDRSKINLGFGDLINAVIQIDEGTDVNRHKSQLLVIIQMVAEAARYNYIENLLKNTTHSQGYEQFMPSLLVISLENNWGALSQAVQQSRNKTFLKPVTLYNRSGEKKNVTNVNQISNQIALMLYVANTSSTLMPFATSDTNNVVRIVGRDEKCVQVKDRNVSVEECNNTNENQVWVIYADGTIRTSSDRSLCVTACGLDQGELIVLGNCIGLDTQHWYIHTNGYIMNPTSGMIMKIKGLKPAQYQIIPISSQ